SNAVLPALCSSCGHRGRSTIRLFRCIHAVGVCRQDPDTRRRGERKPVMTFKPNLIVLAMAAAGMLVAGRVPAAALPAGPSGQDASAPRADNGKSDSESKRKQDMEDQLATQLNTIT